MARMERLEIDSGTGKRIIIGREITIRTQFGLWFNKNMIKHNMTHADIAKKLHISRGHVSGHASGYVRPTFLNVISYCWVFGGNDDPEVVWKKVDEPLV
jgi:hypothetical protein